MRHAPIFLAVAVACAPSAREGGAATTAPAAGVTVEEAAALVRGGALLLDVRTGQEYAAGHLPGALHVPYDQLDARASELGDPGSPVVVYCRSGRRSAIAATTLGRLGWKRVHDLGGMPSSWPAAPAGLARQ